MKKMFKTQLSHWSDKKLAVSSIVSIIIFIGSVFISDAAAKFAGGRVMVNVPDLIISNIPTVNVDFIVNEIALTTFVAMFVVIMLQPKTVSFAFKSAALFVLIRAAFITLTHLGPFPDRSYIDNTSMMSSFNLGSDFFFSGHTGFPFLMALVYWKNVYIRYAMIIASVLFGASVLLGHLHYSIDVFGAFFITYSIFCMAKKFFHKDYVLAEKQELL